MECSTSFYFIRSTHISPSSFSLESFEKRKNQFLYIHLISFLFCLNFNKYIVNYNNFDWAKLKLKNKLHLKLHVQTRFWWACRIATSNIDVVSQYLVNYRIVQIQYLARLISRKIRNDPRVSREITPRDKLNLIDQK